MTQTETYKEIKQSLTDDFEKIHEIISSAICVISNENQELSLELTKYLLGSSKQLRSCLIFLFSRMLYGVPNTDTYKLAAAVEIIHNATLIHDDVIDNADFRRGEISLHKKYNTNLAVISGDFLLALAINILNSIKVQSIITNFSSCLIELCKGEVNQFFAKKTTSTIEDYLKKSEAKTASLFVAALKSLADINNDNSELCTEFAKHFGTAFQVKDDLNNFIKEAEAKPMFLDIEQGIYTAPVIYAFGENKDLSNISTEEIITKASQKEPIEKTKNLLSKITKKAYSTLDSNYNIKSKRAKEDIERICNLVKKLNN